ncbi:MAG TPA: HdeD family acid-resistance protein [Gemmatimonadales bacterium]|nr:HdeD family acid-resistance protein [Gemmatimonadales bacterium]
MNDLLTRNWGLVALRGVVALLFGLFTLFYPGISLAALVLVFGAFAFADGVFTVIAAIANRRGEPHWVALLLSGIAGIVIGVVTFFSPAITAIVLLAFIAAWAIITGVGEIAAAIRLRRVINNEWLMGIAGVLSVLFGVLLIAMPGVGALAVVLWIGAYATVLGIIFLVLAFRLRRWGRLHGIGVAPGTV